MVNQASGVHGSERIGHARGNHQEGARLELTDQALENDTFRFRGSSPDGVRT
jgi:hypothetical protein